MVSQFQKMYLAFKKAYETLEKNLPVFDDEMDLITVIYKLIENSFIKKIILDVM